METRSNKTAQQEVVPISTHKMDVTSLRRASSAGYRFTDRSRGPITRSTGSHQPAANRARYDREEAQGPNSADEVKQDQLWEDIVLKERRTAREWESNWSFLLNCDYMGRPRKVEPLPTYVPFFSDGPSTTSQLFSSRLSSPLGTELIRLDRSCLWPRSFQHKHKPDAEKLL